MRIVSNLAQEFIERSAEYSNHDAQGRDIIALVNEFGDRCDDFMWETNDHHYSVAWRNFLAEHQHQLTIPMVGHVIYLLVTYWPMGQRLFSTLPTLEKMLLRDHVAEVSEEIQRRSAAYDGNMPVDDKTNVSAR